MRRHRGQRLLLALLVALVVQVGLTGQVWADGKTYHWDYINVDIAVRPDGDLEIIETHRYIFTQGTFSFAYREIPLSRAERIDDVWVEEDGQVYSPSQVEIRETGGYLRIKWTYPPTRDAARTFRIHYRVRGGLRIYEGGDQLWWKAVFSERDFAVNSARVTVRLPASVAPAELKIATYGSSAEYSLVDSRTILFTAGRMPGGEELEVRVQFPHGLVDAAPAAWQAAFDRQAAYDENVRPLVNLLAAALGLLLLVLGLLGVLLLWYFKGRGRHVGPVAEYLSELPSELRPGLAGVLLDERADMRDIVATIVDLARRGIIEMCEEQEPGFLGIGTRRDFVFRMLDGGGLLRPFEAEVVHRFFAGRRERRLSHLRDKFYNSLPAIRSRMYAEVVEAGLFPRSPEAIRQQYILLGAGAALLGIVGAIAGGVVLSRYTGAGFCPGAALALTGIALAVAGALMPRRTLQGAEEAARWRAFRRYLADVERYTDLAAARDIFDRYLPYAIAFGLDREWIRKFASVDAPAPPWYRPYPPVVVTGGPRRGIPGSPTPDLSKGGGPVPSLDGMSEGLSGSLQSMSDSLSAMLNSASSTLSSSPSSSGGGGWSGGGGRGGGGGGGGRGGAG